MIFTNRRNRAKRAGCAVALTFFAAAGSVLLPAMADDKADEQPVYKYTGNLFSLKFHRPSCKFARAMWREHVIRFQYRKQAVDAGQKPCRYCLPPDWKSVDSKIVSPHSADNATSPGLKAGAMLALPGPNPPPASSDSSLEDTTSDTTPNRANSGEQLRIPVDPESFGLKTTNSDSDQPTAKSPEK